MNCAGNSHPTSPGTTRTDQPWNNPHVAEMMKHQVQARDRIGAYHQLQQQGRAEEAREYLERLVAESPDAEATFFLGLERMQRKAYRQAVEAFQASLQFDPKNARAHLELAMAQFELGENRAAADSAAKAVALQANLASAHSLRGRALKRLKLRDESLQAFRDAVIVQPESAELQRELGEELAEAGRVAEGLVHLEDAVKLGPPGDPRYRAALEKWKGKK
jgi:tetratricopeptide (TPR) repeat protein